MSAKNLFSKSFPAESEPVRPASNSAAGRLFPKSAPGEAEPASNSLEGSTADLFPKSAPREPEPDKPASDSVSDRLFPAVAADQDAAERLEEARAEAAELRPISPESLVTAMESLEGFDFVIDEEAAEQASETLGEMGVDLTPVQQGKLVEAAAAHTQRVLEQADTERMDHFEGTIRTWEDEITTSPEGRRDLVDAHDFFQEYGDEDLRGFLNDSGLGSFPGLIRALARAQRDRN